MAFGSMLDAAIDTESARKARGAFFTPPELASNIANWAIKSCGDAVLEPSCGEAEFLIAAYHALRARGAASEEASAQVEGCDLHSDSLRMADVRCSKLSFFPRFHVGDFFRFESEKLYDAVIGNPPYVRFQDIEPEQWLVIGEIMERHGVEYSALSSIWAPFVIHAASFLKEGGRLGLVLPAELLTVNYAAPVRAFLMGEFASVSLVTFDERIFPEVQEEVVVLLADGFQRGSAESIEWKQCSSIEDFNLGVSVRYSPESPSARWSAGLVSSDARSALDDLMGEEFCRLDSWGKISLGSVTGNNSFFVLSDDDLHEWGLGKKDVVPLSPPGSRHLRKLALTNSDMKKHRRANKGVWLFYPGKHPSNEALEYISHGESIGVDRGYKCSKRSPWWIVPVTRIPDMMITYMNDFAPSFCANRARVRILNSVHGLYLNDDLKAEGSKFLPLATLNSATALASEMTGRAYGGGLLKIEPREAAALIVPSPELIGRAKDELTRRRTDIERAVLESGWLGASLIVDEVLCECMEGDSREAFGLLRGEKQRLYARRKLRSVGC